MAALNLIFDADDTLWESNIHFLRAESEFVATLRAAGCSLSEVELCRLVREHELKVIETHGYGRRPYVVALMNVIEALGAQFSCLDGVSAEVEQIARRLLNCRCEVCPGVRETLAELVTRHRLILFTKGDAEDQSAKLKSARLEGFFSHVEVAAEKDLSTYLALLERLKLARAQTVMIGNSPRSDINPAVKAGIRAVYIPHPKTWIHEQEELDESNGRVTTLSHFAELRRLF
jgi:putative hydrolase of the HAD superfamily